MTDWRWRSRFVGLIACFWVNLAVGQWVVFDPVHNAWVSFTPVVPAVTVVPATPASVSAKPADRPKRIERYYLEGASRLSSFDRPMGSAEPVDRIEKGVIIREYYYLDPRVSSSGESNTTRPPAEVPSMRLGMGPLARADLSKEEPANEAQSEKPAKLKVPEFDASAAEAETPKKMSLSISPLGPPTTTEVDKKKDGETSAEPNKIPSKPEAGKTTMATEPPRIVGLLTSRKGGSKLPSMKLFFFHRGRQHADRSAETNAKGEFSLRLEPGAWLVYLEFPDGERQFLQTITVDPDTKELAISG